MNPFDRITTFQTPWTLPKYSSYYIRLLGAALFTVPYILSFRSYAGVKQKKTFLSYGGEVYRIRITVFL